MSILGAEVADQEQRHQGEPRHGGGQTEGGAGLGGWGPVEPGGEQPTQEVEEVEGEEDSDGEEVGGPGGGLVHGLGQPQQRGVEAEVEEAHEEDAERGPPHPPHHGQVAQRGARGHLHLHLLHLAWPRVQLVEGVAGERGVDEQRGEQEHRGEQEVPGGRAHAVPLPGRQQHHGQARGQDATESLPANQK